MAAPHELPAFPMPKSVLVTGISGNLGRALAKLLHTETQVIGLDRRPFHGRPKDIAHHRLDIRKAKVEDVFRQRRPEALIHMGIVHDPRVPRSEAHSFNVVGTHKILEWCERHGVRKVVVLSSANVYGPRPDNSNFLPEETPLMAADPDLRDGCRYEENGYTVEAEIAPEATGAGTLYGIRITVSRSGEELASLPASRYMPGEVPE